MGCKNSKASKPEATGEKPVAETGAAGNQPEGQPGANQPGGAENNQGGNNNQGNIIQPVSA
mgnify:CR=1 FL=1